MVDAEMEVIRTMVTVTPFVDDSNQAFMPTLEPDDDPSIDPGVQESNLEIEGDKRSYMAWRAAAGAAAGAEAGAEAAGMDLMNPESVDILLGIADATNRRRAREASGLTPIRITAPRLGTTESGNTSDASIPEIVRQKGLAARLAGQMGQGGSAAAGSGAMDQDQ